MQVIILALVTSVTIAAYTAVNGPGTGAGTLHQFGSMVAMVRSAAIGVVSLAAYAIVIWVASISPMDPVSALREASVIVATVMGWLFLVKQVRRRLVTWLVATGAAWIGLRR